MHIKFIGPLNCGGGGQLLPIFIDLVSTNILLLMLGFPLTQKGNADFCFKPSWLFFLIYSEFHFIFFTIYTYNLLQAFPQNNL